MADDLRQARGVERPRDRRARRAGAGAPGRRLADQRERRGDAPREVRGRAVTVDVQVEEARRLAKEVVVQRRDVQAAGQNRGHHRVHLVLGQDQVPHHDVAAIAPGEGDPPAEPQRRRRRHAGDRDLEVVPRDVHLEHAVFEVTRAPEDVQHRGVVGWHLLCRHGQRGDQGGCQDRNDAHGAGAFSLPQAAGGPGLAQAAAWSSAVRVGQSGRRLPFITPRPCPAGSPVY